jgi:hypothetical protein
MTSALVSLLFAAAALLFALALAFLPLRLLVLGMARSVRGSLREWVQRRHGDRRSAPRPNEDRRKPAPPPYGEMSAEAKAEEERRRADRRDTDRRGTPADQAGAP